MSWRTGVTVPVVEEHLQRLHMSWDEFLAFDVAGKAEWVDGEVVVSQPNNREHSRVAGKLAVVLGMALPDLDVHVEPGLRLPGNRLRGPDLIVVEGDLDTTWIEDAPILVVEVLSPSTRTEDTRVKPPEYAAAGVGHLWLVDPRDRRIECFDNAGGSWRLALRLDLESPIGEVLVGGRTVSIELTRVFRG